MKHITRKIKGFTLIELLVAIAIISILAAAVLVSMLGYGKKARASRAMAQASSVIPSMVSCAGNNGVPQDPAASTYICKIGGADIPSYGTWPTLPAGYSVANFSWTNSSSWYFRVAGESQTICCNSTMNSCGMQTPCTRSTIW